MLAAWLAAAVGIVCVPHALANALHAPQAWWPGLSSPNAQTGALVISRSSLSLWRGDYALLLTGGLVLFGGTGVFHAVLNAGRDGKQDGRLLVASLSLSQLVTCAQVLSVIHQLDIERGEPRPALKGVRLLSCYLSGFSVN